MLPQKELFSNKYLCSKTVTQLHETTEDLQIILGIINSQGRFVLFTKTELIAVGYYLVVRATAR